MSTKNWQQKLNFHLLLLTKNKKQIEMICISVFFYAGSGKN
jgi:hypothetical protein